MARLASSLLTLVLFSQAWSNLARRSSDHVIVLAGMCFFGCLVLFRPLRLNPVFVGFLGCLGFVGIAAPDSGCFGCVVGPNFPKGMVNGMVNGMGLNN